MNPPFSGNIPPPSRYLTVRANRIPPRQGLAQEHSMSGRPSSSRATILTTTVYLCLSFSDSLLRHSLKRSIHKKEFTFFVLD